MFWSKFLVVKNLRILVPLNKKWLTINKLLSFEYNLLSKRKDKIIDTFAQTYLIPMQLFTYCDTFTSVLIVCWKTSWWWMNPQGQSVLFTCETPPGDLLFVVRKVLLSLGRGIYEQDHNFLVELFCWKKLK